MDTNMSENSHAMGDGHDHKGSNADGFWNRTETRIISVAAFVYLIGLTVFMGIGGVTDFQIVAFNGMGFSVSDTIFLIALIIGGIPTVPHGLKSILELNMSIEFLISIAVIGALVLGKFVEATSLIVLYGIAELLEDFSMIKAENSLEELLELSPQTATVKRGQEEMRVTVDEIEVGEIVTVRPGEKIAMDGQVINGQSTVNESTVTGESMPVNKSPGDTVYAGTFNEDGYLEFEVTARADDNTLARIIKMVKKAEATRAPSQQFVDRFASYYTPSVVGLALLTGIIVPFLPGIPGGFETWWLRSMALLVIACPCGLLISTPVTVVSGITSAARNGTLIKGGDSFETLGRINVICFDKTGTLTESDPSVADVIAFGEHKEEDVLRIASSLEFTSEHHIADAIVKFSKSRNIEPLETEQFESITATGVSARITGTRYWCGKPELFDFDPPPEFEQLESDGKTTVCVGTDSELIGLVAISDSVRLSANLAVRRLQELGLKVVMITGDNTQTAKRVASSLGIDEFHSELLPEDKVKRIKELKQKYGRVAMVGDGINDAPALAASDVGIAMGAAGTDTAIETADVALMGDDLKHVIYAVRLSLSGGRIIKQNIYSSIAVKLLLAIGVILGWVNLIMAVLVGDMGVTFGITGNAMRLRSIGSSD